MHFSQKRAFKLKAQRLFFVEKVLYVGTIQQSFNYILWELLKNSKTGSILTAHLYSAVFQHTDKIVEKSEPRQIRADNRQNKSGEHICNAEFLPPHEIHAHAEYHHRPDQREIIKRLPVHYVLQQV